MAIAQRDDYPARLEIDYPDRLSRLTTFFRIFLVIPIFVILVIIQGGSTANWGGSDADPLAWTGVSAAGLSVATALMIVFRQRYPRWWFDFQLEFARFSSRFATYLALMRDEYPSTEDEQAVHLDLDYPDATQLNRWLPLVKWLLAIPHYVVLFFLVIAGAFVLVFAWFAILITGRYPVWAFNFLLGLARWSLRVQAYAFLMLTDRYPPFSLR